MEMEANGNEVLIEGGLTADRLVHTRGDLRVKGNLRADRVDVHKHADIGGSLDAHEISVGGSLSVEGITKTDKADVGGSLRCGSDADLGRVDVGGSAEMFGTTRSERIDVGGKFIGRGRIVSDDVDVGGSFEAGEVELGKLDVGGTATIGGGSVGRKIDIGGMFRSTGPLKFSAISVGGVASLSGGIGEDIVVGGKLDSEGSLTFNKLRVGGVANINGDALGRDVRVGGIFRATGRVMIEDEFSVGGAAEVRGPIEADTVKVGGSIKAESVVAKRSIETHKIITVKGAKADRIEIGRRGEASGPLVGREVVIQRGAYVEDVWGDRVVLLSGARARNIYAGFLEAEEGSDVTGSILFTGELHAERGCRFTAQPAKAEKLPDRPI